VRERESERVRVGKKQKRSQIAKDILQGDGLYGKELIHGIIGSGNCLPDMKRR
jgi:hypothetical protein